MIRAVQLGVHDYFQQVAFNVAESVVGVAVPNFSGTLQELKRGTFDQSTNWIPIPDEYLGSATPCPVSTHASGASRSATSGPASSVSGGSVGTGMSTLTQDTPRESVARIDNPGADSEFSSLTLRPGGTRAILRANRPPANDAGHEF